MKPSHATLAAELASHDTIRAACTAAGMPERTAYHLLEDPAFAKHVQDLRAAREAELLARLPRGALPRRAAPSRPVIRPAGSITLSGWCVKYFRERDLSPSYQQQLRLTVECFERYAGEVPVAMLADDLVNDWLIQLGKRGGSPQTVRTQRRNLLVLWRDAYAAGKAPQPGRIRQIKCPPLLPQAWSVDEMSAILEAACKTSGRFHRSMVSRPAYWRALILTAWDTSLRLGDLQGIRREDVGADGRMIIVQHKTGFPVRCRLSPDTVAAIQATFPPFRELVFGEVLSRAHIFMQFKEIVVSVGLKGGTKKIRKSSATAIEAEHPGAAMQQLGHQTPGLAYKHYVDPRFLGLSKPLPPALNGGVV